MLIAKTSSTDVFNWSYLNKILNRLNNIYIAFLFFFSFIAGPVCFFHITFSLLSPLAPDIKLFFPMNTNIEYKIFKKLNRVLYDLILNFTKDRRKG